MEGVGERGGGRGRAAVIKTSRMIAGMIAGHVARHAVRDVEGQAGQARQARQASQGKAS